MTTLSTIVAVAGAAAGIAGVVFGVFKARSDNARALLDAHTDERAEIRELLAIKDEMIESLKQANGELREQVRQALAREDAWLGERDDYRRRLEAMEEAYRQIVEAVVDAGICAIAWTCPRRVVPAGDPTLGKPEC